jgi:hypothetical protein
MLSCTPASSCCVHCPFQEKTTACQQALHARSDACCQRESLGSGDRRRRNEMQLAVGVGLPNFWVFDCSDVRIFTATRRQGKVRSQTEGRRFILLSRAARSET